MSEFSVIAQILIWVIPVLYAITLHEVGHGWVAKQLGDNTAEFMGRLTVNPLKHIDPVGSIVVPLAMFFFSGFVFGWAKPVPVNWTNLKNRKRDMALVALAGPAANLLMILFWLTLAKLFYSAAEQGNNIAQIILLMSWAGIIINSLLMIFNLFPLPPLDGSRVVFSLLPDKLAWKYAKLEPYGLIILVVLLISGVLGKVIGPLISGFEKIMYSLIV